MLIGLLAGIATGALWGLTFIAPLAVAPASAWDLTVVRYEIFGLACLALMASPRFRPGPMRLTQLATGLLLGALAFTGYVAGIFLAVRLAGSRDPAARRRALADRSGARRQSQRRGPALADRRAAARAGRDGPLSRQRLGARGGADFARRADILAGILCACGSLAIWVVYATVNARVMRAPDPPDAVRWTGLQGFGAALGSLALLPLTTFRSGADLVPPVHDRNGASLPRLGGRDGARPAPGSRPGAGSWRRGGCRSASPRSSSSARRCSGSSTASSTRAAGRGYLEGAGRDAPDRRRRPRHRGLRAAAPGQRISRSRAWPQLDPPTGLTAIGSRRSPSPASPS